MSFRAKFIVAVAAVGAFSLPPLAQAEEFIQVNGLPCGEFCRAWMGIKLPPKPKEAEAAGAKSAKPRKTAAASHRVTATLDSENGSPSDHVTRRARKTQRATEEASEGAKADRSASLRAAAKPARSDESAGADLATGADGKRESHAALPAVAAAPATSPIRREPEKPADVAKPEAPAPNVAASPTPAASETGEPAKPAVAAAEPPAPTPSVAASPTPVASETDGGPEKPVEAAKPEAPSAPAASEARSSAAPPEAAKSGDDAASSDRGAAKSATGTEIANLSPTSPTEGQAEVLIVVARPEIKSVADLQNRSVVVTGVDSISVARIAKAFATAGATDTKLQHGVEGDVDKLWSGEVEAAVVAATTPRIAAGFGPIPGYQVLLVPAPPRAP